MGQKNTISYKEITFLKELCEEIRKYQGVSGSAESLFGLGKDFMERVNLDSVTIIRNPGWIIATGKTCDYDFEIHRFGSVLRIEKKSKERDVIIIRIIDEASNVCINSTIINYKVNNNLLLKDKSVRGKGNATLLCDYNGNFIKEEQFWDTHESLDGNKSFKPYVMHQILQAIDNEVVLSKSHKSFYDKSVQSIISYRKYAIRKNSEDQKYLVTTADISEETYSNLLEGTSSSKKEEGEKPKQKLKDRLFKHKA